MSDIKQLALEVFEGREEAEKRIPAKVTDLEDYVRKIIEIFGISNSSENSTVLVWQVRLHYEEYRCAGYRQYDNISFMLSFEKDEDGSKVYGCEFHSIAVFRPPMKKCSDFGDNERLRKHIENLKIPAKEAKNISKYFKENLSEYFETEDGSEYIIIKMKRKKDS